MMKLRCLLAMALVASASCVCAQTQAIDTAQSSLTIRVGRAGLFSGLGHEHTVRAPIAAGEVDQGKRSVSLSVRARDLVVADPGESDATRAEIQKRMLGPDVLDAERFPEIGFRSTQMEKNPGQIREYRSANRWQVTGELELHGVKARITVDVNEREGGFVGSAVVKQRDFGMTPVTVGGGAVKVKNEVVVEFQVKLQPAK